MTEAEIKKIVFDYQYGVIHAEEILKILTDAMELELFRKENERFLENHKGGYRPMNVDTYVQKLR